MDRKRYGSITLYCKPNGKIASTEDNHEGHRERLRKIAFKDVELEYLGDVELLELVLSYAIPRRDTRPLAKNILTYYGSISSVFQSTPGKLMRFEGMTRPAAILLTSIKSMLVNAEYTLAIRAPGNSVAIFAKVGFEGVAVMLLDAAFRIISLLKYNTKKLPIREIVSAYAMRGAVYAVVGLSDFGRVPKSIDLDSFKLLQEALMYMNGGLLDIIYLTDFGVYLASNMPSCDEDTAFVFIPYCDLTGFISDFRPPKSNIKVLKPETRELLMDASFLRVRTKKPPLPDE